MRLRLLAHAACALAWGAQALRHASDGTPTWNLPSRLDRKSVRRLFPDAPAATGGGGSTAAAAGSEPLNRTVWLYWHSGWEQAPYVVRKVGESWRKQNPTWRVVLLSDENLARYVDTSGWNKRMKKAAFSDMLRLTLLSTYGGVWADATLLCMRPLDDWVYNQTAASKFWMYHGRESDQCEPQPCGPSSWFLAATSDAYIIQEWHKKAVEFWSGRKEVQYPYFWLDALFELLLKHDARFRSQWTSVPVVNNGDPCQSHTLHADPKSEVNMPLSAYVKDCLDRRPPYAVKLSWKGNAGRRAIGEGRPTDTNGNYAIFKALGSA